MTESEALKNYLRYSKDPWAFLTECVFTRDAVDEAQPVKLFPNREYLRLFTLLWLKEKKIAVPKSRRMTMSWTCIALTLWDCIFHKGREWAFVSKKEDDSAELVSRADFIFRRIPGTKIPKSLLPKIKGGKMTKSPPRLEFDFGNNDTSYIMGFPMGADQLRQFTFSGIFGDECAFWEVAEEFYTGAKPTTDGGGRMILVSSRSPGFFKKIVFDKINAKSMNFPELPPAPVKRPMEGIELWKNPTNEFLVIDTHYTADPEKRHESFRESLKATLPLHQYLREYERNWQTFSGLPVYPNFRSDLHCPENKPKAHLGLPLLVGIDFGLTPAAVVGQLQGNSLKILEEHVSQNEGIVTFMPKVLAALKQSFPEWTTDNIHFFIDPAGFQRAQTDARTCAQEMSEAGCKHIEPGPVAWEKRKSAVEHFLIYVDKEGAGLEINEERCPLIVEGFRGAYRYADSQSEVESQKPRPIKNAWSHPHDALQYLAYGSQQLNTQITTNIPIPTYGFQKESAQGRLNYGRKLGN